MICIYRDNSIRFLNNNGHTDKNQSFFVTVDTKKTLDRGKDCCMLSPFGDQKLSYSILFFAHGLLSSSLYRFH